MLWKLVSSCSLPRLLWLHLLRALEGGGESTWDLSFYLLRFNLLEQCSLTGGRQSSLAISVFLIVPACSNVFPLTHSVAKLLDAIAEPHPKVLNFASMILPSSSTLIWSFITSPHAGAPTSPVPTFLSCLSKLPTFLGFE